MNENTYTPEGPVVLRQYAAILKRRLPLIAAITLACTLLGGLFAIAKRGDFKGITTVVVSQLPGEKTPGGGRSRTVNLDTELVRARSSDIVAAVATSLGVPEGQARTQSDVAAASTGDILYFTFVSPKGANARLGADAYAQTYLDARRASGLATLEERRSALRKEVGDLDIELAQLVQTIDIARANGTDASVERQRRDLVAELLAETRGELSTISAGVDPGSITRAAPSPGRTGVKLPIGVLGGLLGGLFLGVFIAFIRDRLDYRFFALDNPEEVGLAQLAEIPVRALSPNQNATSDVDVQHALLRLLLHLQRTADKTGKGTTIMFTAPDEVSVNSIGGLLQTLVNVAKSNGESAAVMQISWAAVFADVLSTPRTDGRWEQVRVVMEQMRGRHDYVLVDAPPFGRSADTLAVASEVDVIVFVASDRTPVASVIKARSELASIGRHATGYIRIRSGSRHQHKRAAASQMSTTPTASALDPAASTAVIEAPDAVTEARPAAAPIRVIESIVKRPEPPATTAAPTPTTHPAEAFVAERSRQAADLVERARAEYGVETQRLREAIAQASSTPILAPDPASAHAATPERPLAPAATPTEANTDTAPRDSTPTAAADRPLDINLIEVSARPSTRTSTRPDDLLLEAVGDFGRLDRPRDR